MDTQHMEILERLKTHRLLTSSAVDSPCQDISAAGKGAGIKGSRSGLWGGLPRVYPGWRERRDLPEPRTLGSTNELPDLVGRNKCVGNAVQPLMAQYLFECIKCFDQ